MELKRGRLIDHLHLRASDLEASRKFYAAVLGVLGIEMISAPDHFSADELWVDAGQPATHVHFAFQTPDRATVDRWHAAGLAAGGATTASRANASIIRATTPPICSTPTATTSRRCTMDPVGARRTR